MSMVKQINEEVKRIENIRKTIKHKTVVEVIKPPFLIECWGWIPCSKNGKEKDEKKLYNMGVQRRLEYIDNGKGGYFNMCICSEKVLNKLIKIWPGIFPSAFTMINKISGKQLPPEKQRYWKMSKR